MVFVGFLTFCIGLIFGAFVTTISPKETEISEITSSLEIKEVTVPLKSTVTHEEITISQYVVNELGSLSHEIKMAEKIHKGLYVIVNTATPDREFPELPSILEIALEIKETGYFDLMSHLK